MGWLLFQKVFVILLGIVATGWVARHLGVEKIGILGGAVALVTYFGVFALGVDPGVFVKRILEEPEREREIMGGTTAVLAVTGFLSWVVLVLWVWLGSQQNELAKWVAIVYGLKMCVTFPAPIAFWFQSQLKLQYTVIPNTLGSIALRLWQVACILLGGGVILIAAADVFALLVILLLSLGLYLHCQKDVRSWKVDWRTGFSIWRASLPALIAGSLFSLLSRMDVLMLTQFRGVQVAGYFTAATALSESLFFMTSLLSLPLAPLLIKARKDEPLLYPKYRENYAKFSALLGWICAIVLSLGSSLAVHIVYGETFETSAGILAFHAFILMPCFLGGAMAVFLTTESLLPWLTAFFSIALVVNFLVNLVLIPSFGAVGAAFASVFGLTTAYVIAPLLFAQTRHLGLLSIRAILWPVPNLQLVKGGA